MKSPVNVALQIGVLGIAALLPLSSSSLAQTVSSNAEVDGYSGQVAVVPNPNLQQITVAFTSTAPLKSASNPSASNQIVFVLHGKFSAYPDAWSGAARVLVSHGFLAVAPSQAQDSSAPNLAFKFPEQDVPPSLKSWSMNTFSVYGIARYGETTSLSADQLNQLETTGTYSRTQSTALDAAADRLQAPALGNAGGAISPDGKGNPMCQAGGPGSNGCGAGGGVQFPANQATMHAARVTGAIA